MENDDHKIMKLFEPLFADVKQEDQFYNKKPLLAHYTSLSALEKIIKTDELWFSNPLYMNDLDEVKFGFFHGARRLKNSQLIKDALGSTQRHEKFVAAFDHYINEFDEKHLLDTYVFCLSEHQPGDEDGLLSMWRGYGSNGSGAAIVFDTSKLIRVDSSPLVIAKVDYGTVNERMEWFERVGSICSKVVTTNQIPDEKLYLAAYALFQRLKNFSLFTKHHGFKEECEWRVVYMSDRDEKNVLKKMQNYHVGQRGVEPKLRLKIEPIEGFTPPGTSLSKFISAILLGPSTSSELAVRSVKRMLELNGKPELKERIIASTIPFRPYDNASR